MLNCGNSPPSKFNSYDDLKKWVWGKDRDQHPDEGLTTSMKRAVEFPGACTSPANIWSVSDVNRTEVTVDGTTYAATRVTFYNYYAAEYITVANNYGPTATGDDGEEPFKGPMPLLQRRVISCSQNTSDLWN